MEPLPEGGHYVEIFRYDDVRHIFFLLEEHKMEPHPEGGHYVEIFRNDDVTHIYFFLDDHDNSHWHR